MKVLHLAAGNRWTGAAAPAFAEVEALRAAGIDAHYAYVGGYKLHAKLRHHDFAHPIIEKAQNPFSFSRSVRKLDEVIDRHGFDILHAHLTYDHWLARMVARGHSNIRVARTFHARRVLRNDPFTRSLLSRTQHFFVINDAFRDAPALQGRAPVFTPPAVDHRQFTPSGPAVSVAKPLRPLITAIGKLSKNRGFEDVLRTFQVLRTKVANAHLMIIGHGEHRPVLEDLASELGIGKDLTWAGYHEDDLAEHYRASDLLLFTARGSDEGHRAILEAMACGVPPATYPLEGTPALLGDIAKWHIAPASTPEALAATAAGILERNQEPIRAAMVERSLEFSYERAAARLRSAYEAPREPDSRPHLPV